MANKIVNIPEIGAVALYKRRGNRSLRLSISSAGEIRVSMPQWLPFAVGERFAIEKAAWIAIHRVKTAPELEHGQQIGKAHRLVFLSSPEVTRVASRLREGEVEIKHPENLPPGHANVQQVARRASLRALRLQAEQLLPQRLRLLAATAGLEYKSVGVRQLKGRWGSCSADGDITLNLFLMQLPWHLIDYVLLHELTHTKVLRHGPPFWAELMRHAPNAKQLRQEIKQHRPLLANTS